MDLRVNKLINITDGNIRWQIVKQPLLTSVSWTSHQILYIVLFLIKPFLWNAICWHFKLFLPPSLSNILSQVPSVMMLILTFSLPITDTFVILISGISLSHPISYPLHLHCLSDPLYLLCQTRFLFVSSLYWHCCRTKTLNSRFYKTRFRFCCTSDGKQF